MDNFISESLYYEYGIVGSNMIFPIRLFLKLLTCPCRTAANFSHYSTCVVVQKPPSIQVLIAPTKSQKTPPQSTLRVQAGLRICQARVSMLRTNISYDPVAVAFTTPHPFNEEIKRISGLSIDSGPEFLLHVKICDG